MNFFEKQKGLPIQFLLINSLRFGDDFKSKIKVVNNSFRQSWVRISPHAGRIFSLEARGRGLLNSKLLTRIR